MRMRTPIAPMRARERDTAASTRPIRPDTSSLGRFQFSLEKAKTVRYSMSRSMQACTTRTRASTPCLWPKKRGRKRFFAHRPLPSMTMATWRGTPALLSALTRTRRSDGHDLGFLGREQLVDLVDDAVGQLLDLVLAATLVVLGDELVLGHLLGLLVGVAAQVAHGDLGILGST